MPHMITLVSRPAIQMRHLYVSFGPDRKVRTVVEYPDADLGERVTTKSTVADPAHPDMFRNWFVVGHFFGVGLPRFVLKYQSPRLHNALFGKVI